MSRCVGNEPTQRPFWSPSPSLAFLQSQHRPAIGHQLVGHRICCFKPTLVSLCPHSRLASAQEKNHPVPDSIPSHSAPPQSHIILCQPDRCLSLGHSLDRTRHLCHLQCPVSLLELGSLVTGVAEKARHTSVRHISVTQKNRNTAKSEESWRKNLVLAYLLLSTKATLGCVWIVHLWVAKHLSRLTIALTRILLSISRHVRIHSRTTSAVLLIWRRHPSVLHLAVVRRPHGLRLSLSGLALLRCCSLGTTTGIGSFR